MAWYEELFASEDPLRFEQYAESEESRAQVDFVVEKLSVGPGARILDLCCGQGRHLLDLMRRGYDVIGVDLSEYMLDKCREAAAKEGVEANLVQADMRELSFNSEFDAVINLFTSFGYFESEGEDQKVLDGVSRALKPGGRLLLDVINRDALMQRFMPKDWQENARGDITVSERAFDPVTGRIDAREVTTYADGRRSEKSHSVRIYTYNEIEKMLSKAGLQIDSAWGGFDSSPFGMTSRRMMVISVKAQ